MEAALDAAGEDKVEPLDSEAVFGRAIVSSG